MSQRLSSRVSEQWGQHSWRRCITCHCLFSSFAASCCYVTSEVLFVSRDVIMVWWCTKGPDVGSKSLTISEEGPTPHSQLHCNGTFCWVIMAIRVKWLQLVWPVLFFISSLTSLVWSTLSCCLFCSFFFLVMSHLDELSSILNNLPNVLILNDPLEWFLTLTLWSVCPFTVFPKVQMLCSFSMAQLCPLLCLVAPHEKLVQCCKHVVFGARKGEKFQVLWFSQRSICLRSNSLGWKKAKLTCAFWFHSQGEWCNGTSPQYPLMCPSPLLLFSPDRETGKFEFRFR